MDEAARETHGNVTWDSNDEYSMTTIHDLVGRKYVVKGYESSADEFQISVDGTVILYYLHDLGGRHVEVKSGDRELVANAMIAVMTRLDMMAEENESA